MLIDVIEDVAGLEKLAPEWNGFLAGCENCDIMYAHEWFLNWSRAFCRRQRLCILVARRRGRIAALLPLMRGYYANFGVKLPVAQSMTNLHSHRFDLIAPEAEAGLLPELLRQAFAQTRRSLLVLDFVPESALLRRAVSSAGLTWRWLESMTAENCLIPVAGSFDDYFSRLQHKFCKNVRAAERRALEHGPLEMRKPENLAALDELLAAGFAVEASGWKGRERTAINTVREAQAFYSTLAPDLYRQQKLDLRLLQCGGENLAFLYSAAGDGVTRMLKIGINNKYRDLGPGMLMILHTAREFFDAGRRTMLDFCGGSARWKRDWSMDREKFYRLFIFRDNLAGTLLFRAASRISARRQRQNNTPAAAAERE